TSFNSAGLIEVYLGDLCERLPRDEWGHWITYNVVPEGTMEGGRFRRDFLAQFASSPDVPSDVRRARARAAEASASIFTHAIWRDLGEDIAPEFESMIGPLSEDPSALGGPLLLLTKCLIDAIDPTPLKEFLKDAEPGNAASHFSVERRNASEDPRTTSSLCGRFTTSDRVGASHTWPARNGTQHFSALAFET
ncbi:MAG: hypothetical protein GY701_24690, partial [Sulfitobacter sp.]|nr:hypothetical protein [Sulfitobacter sp.]